MNKKMTRREALRWMALSTTALLAGCTHLIGPTSNPTTNLTSSPTSHLTSIPPAGMDPTQSPTNPAQPAAASPVSPTATWQATHVPKGGTLAQVFFTADISSGGLMKVYTALGRQPHGNVAVKISSGEPGGHHYLAPDLIAPLVREINGTIVECNTAYSGRRSDTASHLHVLEAHGFAAIAPVDIMDADGIMSLPITGGKHLNEVVVGSHFAGYDFVVNLAHFKGHAMGGFGGVIKNMAIGIASAMGKSLIHSAGTETTGFGLNTPQDDFLESMAEAAKGLADYLGGNILYIDVMNNLSVDCDCDSHPADPKMQDIGILASLDPVALDQACVDLVCAAPDGRDLMARMEARHGIHTLEHAEALGLGRRQYEWVNLD